MNIAVILRSGTLLALFLASPVAVHGQWREGGEVVPDTAWSKHQHRFGAMLLLSAQPEIFLEAWAQPTEGVPIQTADTVPRGVPVVAFVLFTGCEPDDQGLCNASVDITVLRPDGSVYSRFEDADLWKMKPAIAEGALELAADYVGVVIEPDDPLGRYTFRVTVRDLNAGITLDLEQHFTAIATGE
jgi:hypothetical protein